MTDAWTQSVIDATDAEIDGVNEERPKRKVAIVGSRDFTDYEFLKEKVFEVIDPSQIECVISGGARGADALAERFADEFELKKDIKPADWTRWGRGAGPMRNTLVVNACDILIAFWMNRTPGTLDAIKKARKR